ncbi:MAG: FtsB family cell division protein [Caulobacterales bacterium]|jgi:cell division protein FtsB
MSGQRQKPAARFAGVDLTRIGLAAAVVYLGAHAMTGRQGVSATMALADQEARLSRELAALEAQRLALKDEVRRLNDKTLDLDLLEERARILIDAAHPDEIILANPAG